uniref:Putative secreted protein n=1 Tax=Ixodes ricinus TaxID=34613 RepID=A0A6B0URK9_IXORI
MHNFTLLLLFFFVIVCLCSYVSSLCERRPMCASRKSAGLPFTTAMRSFRLGQASGGRGGGREEPCFYKRERGGKLPSPALASYNTSLWGFVRRTVFAPFRRRTRLAEQLAAVQEVYQTRLRWQKRLLLLSF